MLSEHGVKGYSMYPLFKPGHRVVLDLNKTQFSKGDIVAFFVSPELVVLHRVISINEGLLICKGDSNPFTDSPVAKDAIYGVLNMVRTNPESWQSAAAYQKPFYLTKMYGRYAQMRKSLFFIMQRVKRLFSSLMA